MPWRSDWTQVVLVLSNNRALLCNGQVQAHHICPITRSNYICCCCCWTLVQLMHQVQRSTPMACSCINQQWRWQSVLVPVNVQQVCTSCALRRCACTLGLHLADQISLSRCNKIATSHLVGCPPLVAGSICFHRESSN